MLKSMMAWCIYLMTLSSSFLKCQRVPAVQHRQPMVAIFYCQYSLICCSGVWPRVELGKLQRLAGRHRGGDWVTVGAVTVSLYVCDCEWVSEWQWVHTQVLHEESVVDCTRQDFDVYENNPVQPFYYPCAGRLLWACLCTRSVFLVIYQRVKSQNANSGKLTQHKVMFMLFDFFFFILFCNYLDKNVLNVSVLLWFWMNWCEIWRFYDISTYQ